MRTSRQHAAVGLGMLLALLTQLAAFGAEDPEAPLTFCRFGPKVRVFPVNPSASNRAGPCDTSARVQALIWECSAPDQVGVKVDGYRKLIRDSVRAECEKYCRSQGSGCQARVDSRVTGMSQCGLETDLEEATAAGQKFGCRSDCSGKAFAFCSFYDTAYRINEPGLLARVAPNCHCVSR